MLGIIVHQLKISGKIEQNCDESVTRVCPFQEEDSPQGPEEEPAEEPENHDQAEPVRQNHAPQHHSAPRAKRE